LYNFMRSGFVAFVAAYLAVPASAVGLPIQEFAPEKPLYVYCQWTVGETERATTQVQALQWRDTITVYDERNRSVSLHSGFYIGALEESLKKRVGSHVSCDGETSPDYPYDSARPGVTYESVGGTMITNVLHKLDPSWFFVDSLSDNIVSIDGLSAPALARLARAADANKGKPSTPQTIASENSDKKSHAGGALTVAPTQSSVDPDWQTKVLAQERRDAADKAKAIADTVRQKAETKAKLAKLFEEMRKRGSAQ
jgi:hypothetical protein